MRWPWPFLRIAHRGVPGHAPENSLRGFLLAITLGGDMVETDLRATADGELVLAHDGRVQAPGRPSIEIARTPLADLRRLPLHDEPLPTLSEALGLRHHGAPLAFNLDIKVPGLAPALLRALWATGRHDGILLTGEAASTFAAVRAGAPWVQAALTLSAQRRKAPMYMLVHAMPRPAGQLYGLRLAAAARAAGVGALSVEQPLATPRTIAVCHRAGLRLVVWTVDDPARMRRLRAAGVDGITTNRLDLLVGLG
jgi:glycerophosphoryl diester phosphodiesterase